MCCSRGGAEFICMVSRSNAVSTQFYLFASCRQRLHLDTCLKVDGDRQYDLGEKEGKNEDDDGVRLSEKERETGTERERESEVRRRHRGQAILRVRNGEGEEGEAGQKGERARKGERDMGEREGEAKTERVATLMALEKAFKQSRSIYCQTARFWVKKPRIKLCTRNPVHCHSNPMWSPFACSSRTPPPHTHT